MNKLVFLLALVPAFAFAELKIATVDMMTLVKNHPSYDSNKKLLTETEKKHSKKLDGFKDDLEKIQEEGKKIADQARNPMLSDAAKAKLEKEMGDVQNRYMSAQQKLRTEAMRLQQDLQDLEASMLKTTTEDLRKKLADYAEKNGYDMILDATAAPYAKKTFDVTVDVLKSMGVENIKTENNDEGK